MQIAGPGLGGALVALVGVAYARSSTPSPSSSPRCAWSVWARPAGPARARSARTDGHVRPCRAADPHARSVCALRRGPRRRLEFRPDGLRRPHGPLPRPRPPARPGVGRRRHRRRQRRRARRRHGRPPRRRAAARLGTGPAMAWLQILGGPTALLIAAARPGLLVGLVPLGAALVGVGVVGATFCALPSGCAMSRVR